MNLPVKEILQKSSRQERYGLVNQKYTKSGLDLLEMEKLLADLAASGETELFRGRIERAIQVLEKYITREVDLCSDDFDIAYSWPKDIATAMVSGWPLIEVESFSPYSYMYPDSVSSIKDLLPHDQSGVLIWRMFSELKKVFPGVLIASMIDDYNDTPAVRGQAFPEEIFNLLLKEGAILETDVPGRDFVFILESNMSRECSAFIKKLEEAGEVREENGELRFYPERSIIESLALHSKNRRQEFKKKGIPLLKNGIPSCPLMDSISYQSGVNKMILHWNILPESLKSQQDKTYALLRSLDLVKQEGYHNAFFKDSLSPQLVVSWAATLLKNALREVLEEIQTVNEWSNFNPEEYVIRNYQTRILPEDRALIEEAIQFLQDNCQKESLGRIIDVGAGPNLYPAMIWSPWIKKDGEIHLQEYVRANRDFLEEEIANPEKWQNFLELMSEIDSSYSESFRLIKKARVDYGSVSDLEESEVDGISAFFVIESITKSRVRVQYLLQKMIDALRPGGVFIFSHMLGSSGYYAGDNTSFPATELTRINLDEIYKNYPVTFEIKTPYHPKKINAREGYHGMALVLGRKNN